MPLRTSSLSAQSLAMVPAGRSSPLRPAGGPSPIKGASDAHALA